MHTTRRRVNLLKGLMNGKRAFIGPEIVDLDLTSRCNLKCLGCPYHSPNIPLEQRNHSLEQDFPVALYHQLLAQLQAAHAHMLVFQGSGEPLLHPQVTEMIEMACSKGFNTHLLTNGILMDGRTAENLLDAGIHGIRISLWASNEDEYSINYPGTSVKNFNRVQENLKVLNELKKVKCSKTRVLIYCVINVHNMESLDNFIEIAKETGCDGIHFGLYYNLFDKKENSLLKKKQRNEISSRMLDVKSKLRRLSLQENVLGFLNRLSLHEESWKEYPCYEPWFHVRIFSNGDVGGCTRCSPQKVYGNLNKNDFEEIWNNSYIQQTRIQYSSPGSIAHLMENCDCKSCCFSWQTKTIYRYFKWFSLFRN